MRTKLQPLNGAQKIERFKECLMALDPVLALNDQFVNGIQPYHKRYNAKTTYYRFHPDNFRTFLARVNTPGTKVSIKLETGSFEEDISWYKFKPEKNATAIATYATFKEKVAANKEKNENEQKNIAAQNEELISLKAVLPKNSKIKLGSTWRDYENFNIEINGINSGLVRQVLQKIKDLV